MSKHTRPMLSARSIAAEVAAGRLTPKKALGLSTAALEQSEDKIRAFVNRPEKLVANKGPLAGIAVGVKDLFDTHDLPTTYGSKIYEAHQPASEASLVSMLKQAGATIAGKTVTTEFAWFSPGPTRNPHDTRFTPGGSSSGSAAGIAAGFFPAAIGSQTGGSIIRPAAFCGVAGYKPSFRLFPTIGMKQFSWSLDTIGFFTAQVADAAFIAQACSQRDLAVNETDETPPKIGVYKSTIDELIEPAMAQALKQAERIVKKNGAYVRKLTGPKIVEAGRQAHGPIQDYEARLALADEKARSSGKLSKKLRDYLKDAETVTPAQYDEARRTANRARKACHDMFSDVDVLLMPSAPGPAPRTLKSTGNSSFNRLWTLMGLPCINIPGFKDENGLPLGLQIVAPFGKDKEALQAAHWLETRIARER